MKRILSKEVNMHRSKIEWVLNPDNKTLGWVWNPLTGCLNGCPYCYARRLANGRLRERYLANTNLAPTNQRSLIGVMAEKSPKANPFYPRFWSERMWLHELVGSKRKAKGIFVCDMSDLFGIGIPEDWTRRVLDVIKKHSRHRFYLLTKQPQNLAKFSPFPNNCFVGVTATDAKMAEEAGFWLWEVKAKVKFISFEPLLERIPVHFADYIGEGIEGINWVIIGQCTPIKQSTMPKIEWVQEIVEAADKAGCKVFLKDNLKPLLRNDQGWTSALYVKARSCSGEEWLRQEMPE